MTLVIEQVAHHENKLDSEIEYSEIPFYAESFLQSQRNVGYDVYSATADLVDNCIDAKATKIWIDVIASKYKKPEGGYKNVIDEKSVYYIADNGCGMDESTLLDAMAIGTKAEHDSSVDLGKFGVGLKQASLALGKTFTVVTKCKDGPIISSTFSCDKIISAGKMVVSRPSVASLEDKKFFNAVTQDSSSGTVVILKDLDNFGISDPKNFKSTLKGQNQLGRIFRFILKGNTEIHVGQKNSKVVPADPVQWDDKETTRFTDGWEKMSVTVGNKEKGSISYRIAKRKKTKGMTHRSQGVIWIRNNREIKSGIDHKFWKPANETYGLYLEIKFSGNFLDRMVKLTTRKDDVKPGQDFVDRLCTELRPIINTIRNNELRAAKEASKATSNIQSELSEYCDDVKKAQKLLDCPKSLTKFRAENVGAGSKSSGKDKKAKNGKPSIDPAGNIVIKSNSCMEFNFSLFPFSKLGVLYQAEQDGNLLKVMVNEDHAFVAKNLIQSTEESSKAAVKNILMAMALAELQVSDEYMSAFEDFKCKFNHNLRILTSEV